MITLVLVVGAVKAVTSVMSAVAKAKESAHALETKRQVVSNLAPPARAQVDKRASRPAVVSVKLSAEDIHVIEKVAPGFLQELQIVDDMRSTAHLPDELFRG